MKFQCNTIAISDHLAMELHCTTIKFDNASLAIHKQASILSGRMGIVFYIQLALSELYYLEMSLSQNQTHFSCFLSLIPS